MPRFGLCLFAVLLGTSGCDRPGVDVPADLPSATFARETRLETRSLPGLSNVVNVTSRIYSGSEPHGDEGFASLVGLGIATIVSVDGARPEIESAHSHGMRYVHIPIGYDGVPAKAAAALTRLTREAHGPMYVHCHHGQHRGPAAAAIAAIACGDVQSGQAAKILELAGTDPNYRGLWHSVETFVPLPSGAALPELVEVAQVGSLAAIMAQIDRNFDNLKLCRESDWSAPARHADLAPLHEALMVKEGLREAARLADQSLKKLLEQAELQAEGIEVALRRSEIGDAEVQFQSLAQSCKKCHASFRNQPRDDH